MDRSSKTKSKGAKSTVLIRKTPKKKLNAGVRRSGRSAAQSGQNETLNMVEPTNVAGKRRRKPNLRYVVDANVPLESKETLPGTEVTDTPTHDGTGTTCTDKKTKKSRKRKNVQYEVNCSEITGFDIKAFVRISISLI